MAKQLLPTTASFRPEVVDEYVRGRILKGNPVTWFAPVVGLLAAGAGFAVFQTLEIWMLFSAAGGIILGAGSLSFDAFVRKDAIRMSYLEKVNQDLEQHADQTVLWLLEEFSNLEHQTGHSLVKRLQRHMDTLEDVLDDKFEKGTESFEHFHGVAELLYVQTLNRLKDTVTQIKANAAIDVGYARSQVRRTSGAEKESHQQKLMLHADGEKKVTELLASAEVAVAGLAELNQKVAGIPSGSMKGFDSFIGEVRSVADRANLYVDERSL